MDANPLVILTHVRHVAVTEGFLPAAKRLGLPVVLLTDHRLDHLEYFSQHPEAAPQQIVECDVFNPLGVIDVLRTLGIRPAAVFSNSDHLQTSTASVAQGLGLPGKDWRVCYAAKGSQTTQPIRSRRALRAPDRRGRRIIELAGRRRRSMPRRFGTAASSTSIAR